MSEPAKISTYLNEDDEGEMILLSVSPEGKCMCLYENANEAISVRVTRRLKHVRPLNDAARAMLATN